MKFSGPIGFSETVEIRPGVMQPKITEKHYKGDVLRKISKWQQGYQANDDLTVNNQISIVANEYAFKHFSSIKYVAAKACFGDRRGLQWRARRHRLKNL